MNTEFREIRQEEISVMFQMILDRMAWMDRREIRQWNVTEYDKAYPMSYYEELRQQGELFVLAESESGRLLCAGALLTSCDRWEEDVPAVYLRHLVSAVDAKGAGLLFMERAEAYARSIGKEYFRLDSADDNAPLTEYYENMGYLPVGTCVDGPYHGILREKKL